MKKSIHLLIISLLFLSCTFESEKTFAQYTRESIELVDLSVDFITATKEGKEVSNFVEKVAKIHPDSLFNQLTTPAQKKAFWINLYNAYIQSILKKDPDSYQDRSAFFSKKQMKIAGKEMSFDDIEHGILRGSTWKFSLGYIKNPFAPEFETKMRAKKIDERIHFALNCGAKSCPPVAIYTAENFDRKVNEVARYFLKKVSTYNKEKNEVYTTTLFSWFRGDFGGENGVRKTLVKYGVLPTESDATIQYSEYDWTLSLGDFYEAN